MLDFFGQLGSFIITPLYYLTSVVLLGFHKVFGGIFGRRPASPGCSRSSA